MEIKQVKHIIEAAMMAYDESMSMKALVGLFPDEEITANDINQALNQLESDYQDRGIMLKKLAKGYRIQTRQAVEPWLKNMWQQRPKKLSRALLETLALIAYRQPITRGEIEDIRGVAVSSKIIHYMMDQEWIRILGYRDVPGKPAMLGTTPAFLAYFNLTSLQELPSLAEIKDIETLEQELEFKELYHNNDQPAAADVNTAENHLQHSSNQAVNNQPQDESLNDHKEESI